MNSPIVPVILCGGSGTRLWPLSRKSFPKQFVPLIEGKSLLRLTAERLQPLATPDAAPGKRPALLCVAAEEHRFLVSDELNAAGAAGEVILEPAGRNTAAAMALAALHIQATQGDALLLFCPADHHIPDAQAFHATIAQGVPAAQSGAIVTFGVVPTHPSTAYGYLSVSGRLHRHQT